MPWASKSTVEVRREFVNLAMAPGSNIRALCRQFNVSSQVGYKTLDRYRAEGESGLQDRSRRPHHSPARCAQATEMTIKAVRADHPAWGARKIAAHLRVSGATAIPAPSTITEILRRNGLLKLAVDEAAEKSGLAWLSKCFHKRLKTDDLPHSIASHPDLPILLRRLEKGSQRDRRRSIAVLASWRGLKNVSVCSILNISRQTFYRYVRLFDAGGVLALFAPRINPHRKFDRENVKKAVFNVLHQPPANFGLNRTTWKMADLSCTLRDIGEPAGQDVIRKILKDAGYRWRKARIVLTSNDPDFSDKLQHIQFILSELKADEAFFSIDEFGPFAIKAQPGRTLVGPNERRVVPQWQRSKGSLIVTAAVELSANQVTHFYSTKKNTDEMIRMMNALVHQYNDRRKIYLSWDAASWHISRKLFEHVDAHNRSVGNTGPVVEIAALPARAQFLNVIELIFSGMSRAVIQNSDYGSVDEAKAAIDRYFVERNVHFKKTPRRAGRKIWGKEQTLAEFSDFNNCKDPRFR